MRTAMKLQEILDRAARHLSAQYPDQSLMLVRLPYHPPHLPSTATSREFREEYVCSFRGRTPTYGGDIRLNGRRSPVGVLIPDCLYEHDMELVGGLQPLLHRWPHALGFPAGHRGVKSGDWKPDPDREDPRQLLQELEEVHAADPKTWLSRITDIFMKYGLENPFREGAKEGWELHGDDLLWTALTEARVALLQNKREDWNAWTHERRVEELQRQTTGVLVKMGSWQAHIYGGPAWKLADTEARRYAPGAP